MTARDDAIFLCGFILGSCDSPPGVITDTINRFIGCDAERTIQVAPVTIPSKGLEELVQSLNASPEPVQKPEGSEHIPVAEKKPRKPWSEKARQAAAERLNARRLAGGLAKKVDAVVGDLKPREQDDTPGNF